MNNNSRADRLLAAALSRGDPEAWASVCDRYGEALYRYAFHLTRGDGAWAEDIRQETLLAAARGASRYRGESPLFGWLCAIARRKAFDELRRRARLSDPPQDENGLRGAGGRLEREPLPEESVERAELRAQTVEALWTLPPEYTRLLVARYADGEDVDALARRIGRSYKATESLLARARAALRERLSEVEHD